MRLSDISIKNPVFAWMLMAGLIIFGAIGFSRMGISQLPDVDFPVLTVSVTWPGASPETMETAVADVIEDAVMRVEGIRTVTTKCLEGISNTTIEFELNRDVNVALQEVQTRIAQAQKVLPTDVDPPIVTKSNPEDNPILWLALTGDVPLRELVLFVRDHLKDAVTTIEGVGDVQLGGFVDPNMRIWLDSAKMQSSQISVDDVAAAIVNQHTLSPSGYMDNGPQETNVRVLSEARTAEQFNELVIPQRAGQPIWKIMRLRDVGEAKEGLADIRRVSHLNGKLAVGLGVVKQRGSNAVAVGRAVKDRLKALQSTLPRGMSIGIINDSTKFIEDSTHELLFTLGLSAILTSIVCWLFLGSWSSAFNVILAIPTSLIGSFIALYFFGFTLNTFTLLALSLSIGIVVDDAIMVLENIVRHTEDGLPRVQAAIVGSREITTAAIAASLAILAIFLPVVFMKGIIGKFFFQFGIAMSVAVMLSLLEALTLAPMRCSQFLETEKNKTGVFRYIDRGMDWLVETYRRTLEACLKRRWLIIGAAVAAFAASLFLLGGVRKEFVPAQDQGRFMVMIRTPMGSSIDRTEAVFKQAEEIVSKRPEVQAFFSAIGGFQGGLVNQGNLVIIMKNRDQRPIASPFTHRPTQQEFMPVIRGMIEKIPGLAKVSVMDPSLAGFAASRGYPIQFSVQGPNWEQLVGLTEKMMSEMSHSGLMTDIDTDYRPGMPEASVIPDRAKAAKHGVTVTNIAHTISALVGSLRVAKYTDETGHRDDVRIKLLEHQNRTAEDINKIWLRNDHGEMVPLSSVVTVDPGKSMLQITRYNRERAISIFANVAPKTSQATAIEFIQTAAARVLPQGYHVVMSGSSQAMQESFQSLMLALFLGIVVAYMVLGSQFNSFIHPATVLLALPFSVTGAFLAMRLTGISLSIYSLIGLLLLMGIVKKNSILLVDFTNAKRAAGMGVRKALLEACPLRLRPILMTSVATITAAIPAALALGPGSETTRPMAVVVIGGVIVSTLLTLIVVPCAYSLLARFSSHKHKTQLREALKNLGELPKTSRLTHEKTHA